MILTRAAFLCLIVVLTVNGDPCAEVPLGHYKELGCTPVYNPGTTCVVKYDCKSLGRAASSVKCFYKNKEYPAGEYMPPKDITNICTAGCNCREGYDNRPADLNCAQIECPEMFRPPSPNTCVLQYQLEKCCSTSRVCDPAEINKLMTCMYEGKVYKEGQRFYPENTCKHCICTKDFDGTLKDSWCREIDCGTEIHHAIDAYHTKCAPIYFENRDCCPIYWKCPESTDNIVAATSPSSEDRCLYGEMRLNIGDKLTTGSDKCLTCKCIVPPMLTCIKTKSC